jgi:hypothetical protein
MSCDPSRKNAMFMYLSFEVSPTETRQVLGSHKSPRMPGQSPPRMHVGLGS